MKPIQSWNIDGATVNIYSEYDSDWSWVEESEVEVLRKISRGDLFQVIIEVKVYDKTGEIDGTDSLGGVVLEYSIKKDFESQVREVINDHAMIDNAKNELDKKIKNILKVYQNETKP
jgi:hypothetical protein